MGVVNMSNYHLCVSSLGEVARAPIGASAWEDWEDVELDALTDAEVDLVKRVWAEQEHNTDRIRLVYYGDRPVVETEFCAFLDDPIWDDVQCIAQEIGAVVGVMRESGRTELVGTKDGRPPSDEYLAENPRPGDDDDPSPPPPGYTWWFGKDHGRMERQISISLGLPHDFDHVGVEAARSKLRAATQSLWEHAGV